MNTISLGDGAQPFILQRQNAQLKTTLQQLSAEISSGVTSDPGKTLSGNFNPLGGIVQSLGALGAYKTAADMAGTVAAAQQTALGAIDSSASELATGLLTASSGAQPVQLQIIAQQSRAALSNAIAQLNTRVAGRSLFSGTATDQPAVSPMDDLLSQIQTATAGQTTASGLEAAVRAWFQSASGYAATAYHGSADPASPIPVAQGETATLGATALNPAIADTLAGLALGAMIDSPALQGNASEQARLAASAGQSLLSGADARTALSAGIGVVQAQISAARTRNAAESSSLQQAQSTMLATDPYATATQLQQTQTQLQTLYALTAQIASLSLSNYLK